MCLSHLASKLYTDYDRLLQDKELAAYRALVQACRGAGAYCLSHRKSPFLQSWNLR